MSRAIADCRVGGAVVVVPEIVDYEIRRELIRARRARGIDRLDALIRQTSYLAITTLAMRRAALLWATARQAGRPTASDPALVCRPANSLMLLLTRRRTRRVRKCLFH